MENALVNANGEIVPADRAKVAVFDRGFIYGDSLYEVCRSYAGAFHHLREHLARLRKSAELCRMHIAQTDAELEAEAYRALAEMQKRPGLGQSEAYCRIIVTRGVGRIGFGLNCVITPSQYFVIVQPVETPTDIQFERGLSLAISTRLRNDRRALDPAMKSGNYLNSLLAYLEAADKNYDDALLCNADGHVTEGTTFNVFYARRGIVATPPLDVGILDGITRRDVMALARKLDYPVREVRFPRERLYEADEVFITSTLKEVFPVTRLDGHAVGGGKPGPITRRLRDAYRAELKT